MTNPADRIPDSISPKDRIEGGKPISQPPSSFESQMQGAPGGTKGTPPSVGTPGGPTPMDLARQPGMQTAGLSMNSLIAQAGTMQDTIGTVGQQLNTPNLKLKRSQSHLLKNKLQDANGYIHSAGAKLGVEKEPLQMAAGLNPAARFLALLGDGQDQLRSVQQKIKELSATPDGISPGDMMYLQIKMSQAQQEIEYSSTLLGKVIQSMTQLLQTQL